jgi:hypothetical protein
MGLASSVSGEVPKFRPTVESTIWRGGCNPVRQLNWRLAMITTAHSSSHAALRVAPATAGIWFRGNLLNWWAVQGSKLRPMDYETDALIIFLIFGNH